MSEFFPIVDPESVTYGEGLVAFVRGYAEGAYPNYIGQNFHVFCAVRTIEDDDADVPYADLWRFAHDMIDSLQRGYGTSHRAVLNELARQMEALVCAEREKTIRAIASIDIPLPQQAKQHGLVMPDDHWQKPPDYTQ